MAERRFDGMMDNSRFAEIKAKLTRGIEGLDGENLIYKVQDEGFDKGDIEKVASRAGIPAGEARQFLKEIVEAAKNAAYRRRFQATTAKSTVSRRFNQFSTDNPQSDRNQIAEERGEENDFWNGQ